MRAATAALLGRLMAQPLHGPRVVLVLQSLLPPSMVTILQVLSLRVSVPRAL